ncbi:MAG: hypothetical protein ACTSQU_06505 [Promethearchaeota archaeon]
MPDQNEKKTPIDSFSIKDIVNLSIVDMVMLQLLLRHSEPVVRHNLYNEISRFLTQEKQKVVELTNFNDVPVGAQKFQEFLHINKKFSSSSLYYSLANLEKKGLVKFNYDKKDRVESVEATQYTEILINTILKHVIKFGVIEAEQNKFLPKIIKEVVEEKVLTGLKNKKFGTMLYICFSNIINAKCISFFSTITNNLFILSNMEAFENVSKLGIDNVQYSSLFNKTIRESDNFFDGVIIPYHFKDIIFKGVSKKTILEEAFRIVKENGVVIIHGYTTLPDIDHAFFNVFTEWVKNIYTDVEFYSEEEFKDKLLKAGAKEAEVFVYKGHLFGVGNKL